MTHLIDLHHHLDTLNALTKARGHLQNHLMSLKEHTREDYKVTISVSLYINFYRGYDFLKTLIQSLKEEINQCGEDVILITSQSDLKKEYKLGILLHVESGRALKDYQNQLPELYDLGIRGIIPLHFIDNHLGNSCDDLFRRLNFKREDLGITKDGEEFIKICNRLGIWIDLTHTSDQTAEDMLASADHVMASHLGIRELKNLDRNKPINFLKRIAQKNGVIGLSPWAHLTGPRFQNYIEHYNYAKENELNGHTCIGSDFGAPIKTKPEIRSIFDIAKLIEDDKFLSKNALSFFMRSLPN